MSADSAATVIRCRIPCPDDGHQNENKLAIREHQETERHRAVHDTTHPHTDATQCCLDRSTEDGYRHQYKSSEHERAQNPARSANKRSRHQRSKNQKPTPWPADSLFLG